MSSLIFSSAVSQSGFTNASTSTSNDKDSSVIVREVLQNSYDSAIEEANESIAKVKFIIETIEKSDIPGITEYENALVSISNEDLSGNEQEADILNVIKEELDNNEITVLHIVDNGIGFNQQKLVAVLSDGISDKANPENSGGSYGNGHFSAYNASNLRYVLYGGKSREGEKICSGQALLRTFKKDGDLKLGTGFLVTEEKSILKENDIFYKNDEIPKIMNDKLDEIATGGGVVSILGFNFFGKSNDVKKVIDLISSSVARNFFVAIRENQLEVEIISNDTNCIINRESLESIFFKTEAEKSEPSFKIAHRFYEVLVNGKNHTLETKEGEVKIYYKESEADKKLALCRNGMWINDAIPRPLNKGNFSDNKPFSALVLPQKNTSLSKLVRRAEGNLHMDLRLNRFSSDKLGKEKKKKLQEVFREIRDYLASVVGENDNESFDVEIPELSINMVGSTKSKEKRQEKVPKTKKVKKRKKVSPVENGDDDNPSKGKGKKKKSKTKKKRVGNPFSVARFSSKHNIKHKEAKVRFSIDKPATNLLLCLRLDDGKDPTCDGYGNIDGNNIYTKRLEIKKAFCNTIECDIINNDTIDIGKKDKDELITLDIEYDTNVKGNYMIDYEFLNSALKKDSK